MYENNMLLNIDYNHKLETRCWKYDVIRLIVWKEWLMHLENAITPRMSWRLLPGGLCH